jgi:hypothetical protein
MTGISMTKTSMSGRALLLQLRCSRLLMHDMDTILLVFILDSLEQVCK